MRPREDTWLNCLGLVFTLGLGLHFFLELELHLLNEVLHNPFYRHCYTCLININFISPHNFPISQIRKLRCRKISKWRIWYLNPGYLTIGPVFLNHCFRLLCEPIVLPPPSQVPLLPLELPSGQKLLWSDLHSWSIQGLQGDIYRGPLTPPFSLHSNQ